MSGLEHARIAFVGGGMMAEAIIRGVLGQQLARPEALIVSDPLEGRRQYLATEMGVQVTGSNLEAVDGAQIIVLAVKPQVLGQVLAELRGQPSETTLVLSIVAGAKIETIRTALATPAVVRIMPNTPGQIGEGISVWTATLETSDVQRQHAAQIITALGQAIYVDEEGDLDKATALSGSGPAYVFLFIEALTDAGVHMGFSRAVAEQLALQTVRGSAIYAQQSGVHPAILRNRVTSPGGTTAEALYQFEEGGLRAMVSRAILAAYHKATSLGELPQG
ncbi:MAG: pyrroline-5-carboxylate reductase [Anaerolineae bacterium]|nr:pyrroline-5-carboxylate reductase [Anaerolineae bacterium]